MSVLIPADLLADRCAFEDFDAEAASARDYHFVALHERAEFLWAARHGARLGAGGTGGP